MRTVAEIDALIGRFEREAEEAVTQEAAFMFDDAIENLRLERDEQDARADEEARGGTP